MAIKGFDFELNGIKYDAAEDAEGDHYTEAAEPLRPPNAVTVQGEKSQKFQMRPDTMQWSLTDWSGGEGQNKYNAQTPNRHRELAAVRVFQKPGTLRPGYYVEDTQDSTGSSDLAKDGILVIGAGDLHLMDFDTNDAYNWDDTNKRWSTAIELVGLGNGIRRQACGDEDFVYWQERATAKVWRWGGGDPASPGLVSSTLVDSGSTFMAQMGNYVYGVSPEYGLAWEISKTPTLITEIDNFAQERGILNRNHITVSDGKIYVMNPLTDTTILREITPSTAAGPGYGAEISRLPGFHGVSIWAHGGTIYMSGHMGTLADDAIMYVIPGGSYGTLGAIRPGKAIGQVGGTQAGAQMLEHHFVTDHVDNAIAIKHSSIFEIDAITGGYAEIARDDAGSAKDLDLYSVATFNGQIFASTEESAATRRVIRAYPEGYSKISSVTSPWHDFDLADEKILSSLVLATEALPADWTVWVEYAIDGSDTWVPVISYTTTSGKGTKTAVSTDSSTVRFRTLSIKIGFTWTGSGIPASGPVVLGVDVLTMVAKPTNVWRLILDLSDSHSGKEGASGATKLANIKAAAATEGVVDFKDGYEDRKPNVFTSHDVVVDSHLIVLSQPGEGIAMVVLKETP